MEDKRTVVDTIVASGTTSLIGFILKVILRRESTTFLTFMMDVVAAVTVGILTGNAVMQFDMSPQIQIAIISLAGMIGPDLLAGILVLATMFSKKPNEFILRYLFLNRGRKVDDSLYDTLRESEESSEKKKEGGEQ